MRIPKRSATVGKCFVCGKATSLNVHQECGKGREKKKPARMSKQNIDYLVKLANG